jgi:exodeoxyribonuclease VII small subunit
VSRKKTEPFEDALKKLEKIVEKLERGSLPLEEAMEAFAEGVRLVKYCNQKLDEAENRVQTLVKSGPEGWTTAAFETPPTTVEQNRTSREPERPAAGDGTALT